MPVADVDFVRAVGFLEAAEVLKVFLQPADLLFVRQFARMIVFVRPAAPDDVRAPVTQASRARTELGQQVSSGDTATNSLTDRGKLITGAASIYDTNGDGTIDAAEAALRVQANSIYSTINEEGDL